MAIVVIALADQDFDPTEAAVPWRCLTEAGHDVRFATSDGRVGACDPDMLTGVLMGIVKATPTHAADYRRMTDCIAFESPCAYSAIQPSEHDLLVLPGGHAQGMRQYLESEALQRAVVRFMEADTPVGAICHGGVVLARSQVEGRSVLSGRRVTTLPKRFEMGAWLATKPTRGDYFRTYPQWVQDEVCEAVGSGGEVLPGPLLPLHGKGYVVEDGNLITSRWPGDAERFGAALVERLSTSTK